jgi:hypothetical protein
LDLCCLSRSHQRCPWIYYHLVSIFIGGISDLRPILELSFPAGLPNLPLDPFLSLCTKSPDHFLKHLVHFLFIMLVLVTRCFSQG